MSQPFEPLEFPAWLSWGRRKGAVLLQPAGTGPNGRKLCRWCATEVPKGCSSWCSDRCVKRYRRVWSWDAVRAYVIERDGACNRCGCGHPGWKQGRGVHRVVYVVAGWNRPRSEGYRAEMCDLFEWWEVDHITPVRNGGTDDPTNLRLLCHACHVAVGYEQRRDEKPQLDMIA